MLVYIYKDWKRWSSNPRNFRGVPADVFFLQPTSTNQGLRIISNLKKPREDEDEVDLAGSTVHRLVLCQRDKDLRSDIPP